MQIVIFCLKNVGADGEEYEKNVIFVGKCVSVYLLHTLSNAKKWIASICVYFLRITGLLTFKEWHYEI